jgi:hypothetical protein
VAPSPSLSMDNRTQDGAVTGSLPNATLNSKFNMVMTNGSAMHDHEIYDFTLTDMSMPNDSTAVFNGTATITMRQGPVPDVPVSIKAMENNAVSIWVDPTKIQNHFGNTPIFGTIERLLEVASRLKNICCSKLLTFRIAIFKFFLFLP